MKRSLWCIFVVSLVLTACGGGSSSSGSGYSSSGDYSSDYDPINDPIKEFSQEQKRLQQESEQWQRQNPSSGSNVPGSYPFDAGNDIRNRVYESDRQRRLNDRGYDALGDSYELEAGQ